MARIALTELRLQTFKRVRFLVSERVLRGFGEGLIDPQI